MQNPQLKTVFFSKGASIIITVVQSYSKGIMACTALLSIHASVVKSVVYVSTGWAKK